MKLKIYQDKTTVAQSFSAFLKEKVAAHSIFHLALSGGSTPKVIFDILAAEYGNQIDWSKIHFYWGDERCVPPSDEQSNYKMTVDHLFSKIKVPSENIHRIYGESIPKWAAKQYDALLEGHLPKKDGVSQFDLVLLGMGDDGHTASIFPHEINLWHSDTNCVVATHPESGQQRVSITGRVINAAKAVAFLVTGENKAEKVKEIHQQLEGYEQYPAALVLPTSGELNWFMDVAAAGEKGK